MRPGGWETVTKSCGYTGISNLLGQGGPMEEVKNEKKDSKG